MIPLQSIDQLPPEFHAIFDALGDKQWTLACALSLTFIISRLRLMSWFTLQTSRIPALAFLVGVVAASATRVVESFYKGVHPVVGLLHGLVEGALIGFASMGWYSLTFKKEKT